MPRQDFFLDADSAIQARGNSNTELAGFCDAARKHDWELVHVLSAIAQPAGAVTRDAFDRLTDPIVAAALAQGDAPRHVANALRRAHGGAAVFVNDQGHENRCDGNRGLRRRLQGVLGRRRCLVL